MGVTWTILDENGAVTPYMSYITFSGNTITIDATTGFPPYPGFRYLNMIACNAIYTA
jgi:hypothetical protein